MSKMLKVNAKDVPERGGRVALGLWGHDLRGWTLLAVIAAAAAKSLNDRTRTAGNSCRSLPCCCYPVFFVVAVVFGAHSSGF